MKIDLELINEKDKGRYKSYCDGISSVLKAFDKANEWADLLKYLQKLQKAIDKDKKNEFHTIPDKLLFAKRIAQCLNPALPSGVHAKTLEILELIYSKMDNGYMSKNLEIGFGMFPLFRSATISIKEKILTIIERCFIPLGANLASCADAFVLAFLPGIEELNSEFYSKTLSLLDMFADAVGTRCFFSSLWMAMLRAPHTRYPALHYLKIRLPAPIIVHDDSSMGTVVKTTTTTTTATTETTEDDDEKAAAETAMETIASSSSSTLEQSSEAVPPDGDDESGLQKQWAETMAPYLPDKDKLVLKALSASLMDEKVLVQRDTLELLVSHFRIESELFSEPHLHSLVRAALLLVTRCETSLNRRLFSWLLGTDISKIQSEPAEAEYAQKYFGTLSKAPTVAALHSLFSVAIHKDPNALLHDLQQQQVQQQQQQQAQQQQQQQQQETQEQQAQSQQQAQQQQRNAVVKEVVRPIKILEQLMEREEIGSQIINDVLYDVFRMLLAHRPDGPYGGPASRGVLKQVQDFIDILDLRVLWSFVGNYARGATATLAEGSQVEAQNLAATLDTLAPPADKAELAELISVHYPSLLAVLAAALTDVLERSPSPYESLACVLHIILKIIGKIPESAAAETAQALPEVMAKAVEDFCAFYCTLAGSNNAAKMETAAAEFIEVYELATQILAELHLRYAQAEGGSYRWFSVLSECCCAESAAVASLSIKAFLGLAYRPIGRVAMERCACPIATLAPRIVHRLWDMLHHSYSAYHYDAAQYLVILDNNSPEVVREEMTRQMTQGSIQERVEGCQRFSLVWKIAGELISASAASSSQHTVGSSTTTTTTTAAAITQSSSSSSTNEENNTNEQQQQQQQQQQPRKWRPFTSGLFFMLDTLQNEHPDIRLKGCSWLADNSDSAERILDPLLLEALDESTVRKDGIVYTAPYDTRRVMYVLRLLHLVFERDSGTLLGSVLHKNVSKDLQALNDKHNAISEDFSYIDITNYADLLVVIALRYIQGLMPDGSDPDLVYANSVVQSAAAEFLDMLLARIGKADLPAAARICTVVQRPILANAAQAISLSNLVLQVKLLALLKTVLELDAKRRASSSATAAAAANHHHNHHNSLNQHQPVMESPMFLQTLLVGLLQPSYKNVRCYWLEFLCSCLLIDSCALQIRAGTLSSALDALCSIIDSIPGASVYESLPFNDIKAVIKAMGIILATQLPNVALDASSSVGGSNASASTATASSPSASPISVATSPAMAMAVPIVSSPPVGKRRTSAAASTSALSVSTSSSGISAATSAEGSSGGVSSGDNNNTNNSSGGNGPAQSSIAGSTPSSSSSGSSSALSSVGSALTTELGSIVDIFLDAFTGGSSSGGNNGGSENTHRPLILSKLNMLLLTMANVYGAEVAKGASAPTSIIHNKYMLQDMIVHILDPILKRYPAEFVRACIPLWHSGPQMQKTVISILNAMECVTDEVIVSACGAIIGSHAPSRKQLSQKPAERAMSEYERSVLLFFAAYIDHSIDVGSLTKAWPVFNSAVRQAFTTMWSVESAGLLLSVLWKYFTRVCAYEKSAKKPPPVNERKERQDLLSKFVDVTLALIASYQGCAPPPPKPDQAPPANPANPAGTENSARMLDLIKALAPRLLPVLLLLFDDVEKLVVIHSNIAHQLVPFMKYKWSPHAEAAVSYFAAACAYPFSVRTLKRDVLDAINDSDFFEPSSPAKPSSLLVLWAPVVNYLMSNDKLAFSDLLSKKKKKKRISLSVHIFIYLF